MKPRLAGLVDLSNTCVAACWYLAIAIAITWPVARGLASDLPSDLGDPAFVSGILARGADEWLKLLSGDTGAIARFWNARFFYPETLATAFSEHFLAHAFQVLPVWAATHNIILCYNLLFLSSYVLSGVGMYLLARELTGAPGASFVAGLVFMCTPYRVASMPHLQVLSAQWMPFALLGLRRYLASGSRLALAGGGASIWLQNLSSGYYLISFAPFAAAYALAEMAGRSMLTRWRTWRDLGLAGVATLAATLPFAIPYLVLKARFQYRRPLDQIDPYGADILAWITTDPRLNLWGGLQVHPAPESLLFLGFAAMALAVIGVWAAWTRPGAVSGDGDRTAPAVALFAAGGIAIAVWIAMGPTPRLAGEPLPIPSLFRVLYDFVPGFDVSRAPGRYAMIVALLLSVLAAYGVCWLASVRARTLTALAGLLVVAEGAAIPFQVNLSFWTSPEVTRPEARLYPEAEAPPVWKYLRTLPADAVVAHFPFGYPEYEIRYVFYSSGIRAQMVNGYSGNFPYSYVDRQARLTRPQLDPEAAWAALLEDGVTHVVVHEGFWPDDTGSRIQAWLEGAGARRLAWFDGSAVYALAPSRDP